MIEFLKELIKIILSLFSKKDDENNGTVVTEPTNGSETDLEPAQQEQNNTEETESQNTNNMEESVYSKIRVHIDYGHASTTPGKRSSYLCSGVLPAIEVYEWKSNREIGGRIKEGLENLGFSVHVVTPENDVDVPLTQRYLRANNDKKQHPDMKHLFLSVHSNAHGHGDAWTTARGWCVYTTKGQNNSDKLADCVYYQAKENLPKLGATTRQQMSDGDPDYEENFTVIYGANMPAILTENLFYTNVEDAKILLSEEGKRLLADIHINGIKDYADKYLLK